jgi:cytoskeletal protein CcmA (bactofilin family)
MRDRRDSDSPARRFTERFERATTILEPGVTIRGTLTGCGGVELGGVLEGEIEAAGLVRIRDTARVTGRISAAAAVVEGSVDGDIDVAGALELRPGCRVVGDLTAASVAIGDGAFFDGRIAMGGAATSRDDVSFTERRGTSE